MSRPVNLDVIVRLRDLLSAPLSRLRSGLESLTRFAQRIGLLGTAIATISFMQPIQQAAAFQQKLIDIAATSNLSGAAAFRFVDEARAKYQDLALQIGQTSDTITTGAGQMIAAGLDPKLIDASIGTIGRSATAANAEFNDMASVATSLLQTLKLPADQLEGAMAGLIASGKEGAFEMKDMAKYFPTLTGQMAKFGVTGREAVNFLGAALQIAKKGTNDPAEAANNLKNFLSKILAPATIKNFQEAGVDIEAVMRDAAVKGINPIEAVLQKITKLTGVSGKEIEGLLKKAKSNGLEGADALAQVRTELEKMHGAGALGGLFSDMQVMDFLIPFLGNVDEFKRIKGEVAEATGGLIDKDFETQMAGLNRQMIRFQEIGTQAIYDVGFAFGTWLPMINSNLEAGLKWLREFDKQTGGWVKQALVFAGGAVLVVAALGALGIILPIVGAGLSAVLALVSPLGVVMAALAYGGYQLYKNWATVGPQLAGIWGKAKSKLLDFYESSKRGGRQLLSFGSELATRFGPRIARGMTQAFGDIKAGLARLRPLFDGFMKGLDLDTSGWTLDRAQLATFQALDVALDGIAKGWEVLKSFGSGFAEYLRPIGQNLGETVNVIGDIASNLLRFADAVLQLAGVNPGKLTDLAAGLGKFLGAITEKVTGYVRDFAKFLNDIASGLADVAEAMSKPFDWSSLLPPAVVSTWKAMAGAINAVKAAIDSLHGTTTYQPGELLPNGTPAGSVDDPSGGRDATLEDSLKGPIQIPQSFKTPVTPPAPANGNKAGTDKRAQLLPASGKQKLEVQTNVAFEGKVLLEATEGTRVASVSSNSRDVKMVASRGRAIGRA